MSDDSYFDDEFPLDEIAVNKDLDLLKLAYRNELIAPDILDCKIDLVMRMKYRIENYENAVRSEEVSTVDDSFRIMLYEMDIERIKYITVSYLRVRIEKIEKYHRYIQQQNLFSRLSSDEIQFLNDITELTNSYFDSTINNHFTKPPYVTSDEDINKTINEIVQFSHYSEDEMNCPFPNRKKLVGVRLFKDQDAVEIPKEGELGLNEDPYIRIAHNRITVMEYEMIEPFLINRIDFELS